MKKYLQLYLTSIFVIALANCKKDSATAIAGSNTANNQRILQVKNDSMTVKGRVLEYGTDKPIEGATVGIFQRESAVDSLNVYGCSGNYVNRITNGIGNFTFKTQFWGCPFSSKSGYWEENQGLTTTFQDSAVIRLIPKTNITIHIKDLTTGGINTPVVFYRLGMWGKIADSAVTPFNQYGSYPGGSIFLHPGIDTTFRYIVYGNTYNVFEILWPGDDPMGNGVGEPLVVYRYVPNDSNDVLNISYNH